MRVLLRRRLVLVGWLSIVVFAAFLSAPSSAAAEPPAPANDTSSVNTPLVIDSGGVPPPVHLQSEAAAEWPIGLRPTNGPGTYDVVVAGVTTALGAPPATSANSAATITGADALWNTSVAGRYRLDYRTYVSTTVSGTTCDLEVLTNAVNSAVSTATEDGTPRPGRVGLIVVISFADDDACSSGLGWVGASGLYVNGYWGAGVGVEITAHEAGHNFRLGHSGGLGCTPDPLQYPAAQSPSWPCKADSSNEYLDLEAMMGASGLGLRPLRIPASQLQVLGILDPATAVVEVGSGVGVYDLVPPLSGATGPQTLRLDVPGTVTGGSGVPSGATVTVEYRTTTASAGGPRVFLDVAGTANPEYAPWGADTWAYRGNSANNT